MSLALVIVDNNSITTALFPGSKNVDKFHNGVQDNTKVGQHSEPQNLRHLI